jgi:hypothetical protein
MDERDHNTLKHVSHWARALRPLIWWAAFVLLLLAIHTHQRLMERTRLEFSMSLDGKPLAFEIIATLDGRPITTGDRLSLGSHTFAVTHSKVEPFSTNLFIWYGEHKLGDINLKRAKGTLTIAANPPAATITVRGPEFAMTLTNSTGTTLLVPTDRYVIEAEYSHWREAGEANVFMNTVGSWTFTPLLCTVRLTCNRAGASFQLLKPDNELVEGGDLPYTIQDLPQGNYKLVAWHHGNRRDETLMTKAGVTNSIEVEYEYGAAVLETEPSGATVATENGREWGTTPLTFLELTPGRWRFLLRREGYETAFVSLDVTGQQTNAFQTNLVSVNYVRAVAAARQYLTEADYDRALVATADALQVRPNDPDAVTAQKEALGRKSLRQAEKLGKQDDYIAALRELESALQSLPESEEAKQLQADFKRREPEQIERLKQERLGRPKRVFDSRMAELKDAALFDSHELMTGKPVKEVEAGILNALQNVRPVFQVTRDSSPQPETFEIEANQELSTILATSAGGRKCLIVGGQTRDDETQIYFKVLEFKAEAVNKLSIGALIGAPAEVKYIPIHPSRVPQMTDKLKAQLLEGVSNVTARIQAAIGH